MKKASNIFKIFLLSFIVFATVAFIADKVFHFRCYQPLIAASALVSFFIVSVRKTKSDV